MKKLLVLLLVLGAVYVGGSYVMTGRLPWVVQSEEDRQVSALREDLSRIRQQWQAAGRTQALGVDASSQVDGTLAQLERLDKDLTELLARIKTTEARNQATSLRQEIATFKRGMR